MSIYRYEVDAVTGVRVEIEQAAYKNALNETIVLDAGITPPAGYSEFTPDPGPSYQQALAALTDDYQSKVSALNSAFALAYLADGSSQEAKQTAIRAQYSTQKDQYSADKAALKSQYGV